MWASASGIFAAKSPAEQLELVVALRARTMRREDDLIVAGLLASEWSGVRSVTLQWLVDRPTVEAAGALLAHARRLPRLPHVSDAEVQLLAVALSRAHAARFALRLFQLRSRAIAPLRFLPEIASELQRTQALLAAVEQARAG